LGLRSDTLDLLPESGEHLCADDENPVPPMPPLFH
jgi:hypothetical protein